MRKRLIIITGLIIAGSVTTWTYRSWRHRAITHRLAVHEQNLSHPNPRKRWSAARGILLSDQTRDDARMILASALVEIGRHAEARQILDEIEHSQEAPRALEALSLHAESYLTEAEDLVASSSASTFDLASQHMDSLINDAASVRKIILQIPEAHAVAIRFQARESDVQARLLRRVVRAHQKQLAEAQANNTSIEISGSGIILSELGRRLDKLEDLIPQLCRQAIELEPNHPVPWHLLFRMRLQSGDVAEARRVAQEIAGLPECDLGLAGYVADTLLDLEARYGHWVTPSDVTTAHLLLSHKQEDGPEPEAMRLARIRLYLRQGRPAKAEEIAREVINASRNHLQATYLLNTALVAQGRADEAVEHLGRYQERVKSPEVLYALGTALQAQGRADRAREALRQAIELDPDHLPSRILVAQSLAQEGYVLEAKRDIVAAGILNPEHHAVKALQTQLFIDQADRSSLAVLLEHWLDDLGPRPDRDVVALAASMCLHDEAKATEYAAVLLGKEPGNVPALIAMAWLQAEQREQLDATAILARALVRHWQNDPLAEAGPPKINVLGGHQMDADRDLPSPLVEAVFVPWPEEAAQKLVDWALIKWPDQPDLLRLSIQLNLWLGQSEVAKQRLDRLANTHNSIHETTTLAAVRTVIDGASPEPVERLAAAMAADRKLTAFQYWLVMAWAVQQENHSLTQQALAHLLVAHPWPERPLLMVMRDGLSKEGADGAFSWLDVCRGVRPRIARLAQSRLSIELGRPTNALHEIRMLQMDEDGGSEIRRLAADVLVRAHQSAGQLGTAVNMFENLAMAGHDQHFDMRLAALDVMIMANHTNNAAALTATLLTDPDTPIRGLDPLLHRASLLMGAPRFDNLLNNLLELRSNNAILMVYKARAAVSMGQPLEVARGWLEQALVERPGAPRILTALAELAVQQNRIEEAAELYRLVTAQNGRAARAAAKRLVELKRPLGPAQVPDKSTEEQKEQPDDS